MTKNHYPVVRKFLMTQQVSSALQCIRVDRELSGQNRRLYRQSRVYRCKVDVVGDRAQSVDVYKLRDSFMLHKGYARAMEEWNKSYVAADEVVKETARARWRDFKISIKPSTFDVFMKSETISSNGTGADATETVVDEYPLSIAYTESGGSKDFGLFADPSTFDIIAEYNKEGKVQAQPNAATSEAAYEELQTDLHDNEVSNLQNSGNLPPYDADNAGASQILEYVGTIFIDTTNGVSKTSTGYFDAPLGAIYCIGTFGAVTSLANVSANVSVEVQGGDYKGVKAHPYVDAKALGSGN